MAQDINHRPRDLEAVERDIRFHRNLQRAEDDAGHEGPALWHEGMIDELLDEWRTIKARH